MQPEGKWTKMLLSTMETEAWRALSRTAQALYPFLKLEWQGAKHNNNGKIQLSVRQAGQKMGCNPDTALRAFHDLQAKGFIAVTEQASLGINGHGKSTSYEVTELAMPSGNRPRKLYEKWRMGKDFEVVKAKSNNPRGKNKSPS